MKKKGLKKLTAALMGIGMVIGLLPGKAAQAEDIPQVKQGYYQDGVWTEGTLSQTLPDGIDSVNKTAEKDPDDPNVYHISLEVTMVQTTTVTPPDSAATVLVIDTSGSMEGDRLRGAKAAANSFIDSYGGDETGTGRYLAIVSFAKGYSTVLSWTDVSSAAGKTTAKNAVRSLTANGGTNFQAGLVAAEALLNEDLVKNLAAKNVVALTDGAPTYYLEPFKWTIGHWSPDITIGGKEYDIKGNGRNGSKDHNDNTEAAAASLRKIATLYTVCYGAKDEKTYNKGPTVGEFLKDSIATTGNAYNADDANELAKAFEAISESITTGLDGEGSYVTDTDTAFVNVSTLPEGVTSETKDGFEWKLSNPVKRVDGDKAYYDYKLEYTIRLDANNASFSEDAWYPLNGETYLNVKNEDGSYTRVDFPVPAGQGVKDRYTVTWKNEDGTTLETDTDVVYGSMPSYDGETPTKDATAQYTYTFAGWDPEVSEVTGDATYTATYTATTNAYTVVWVNDDDSELEKDENVEYGTMPSYDGATPTKESTAQFNYTFAGWTPAVTTVSSDATYKAMYTSEERTYTVTWVDDDDRILEVDANTPYNSMPSYDGDTPVKTNTAEYTYTFAGWTPEITPVTGDVTYKAVYDAVKNTYTVKWVNYDNTLLEEDTEVEYGTTPEYNGETPAREKNEQFTYTFTGWNPEISPVTGNVTYTAQYDSTVNNYIVRWVDEDGTVLEVDENVEYGTDPSYDSAEPVKPATAEYTYTFNGWNPEVSVVTGDVTYTAQYTAVKNNYTVTWLNDGGALLEKDIDVPYGTDPEYNGETPIKEATAEYTFTFDGWNPELSPVTGNITYTAKYTSSKNAYKVTWVNYDNTVLETDENVEYGTMPSYDSATPTKTATAEYTYTFSGWNPEVSAVTGDVTYTAQYTETRNNYTVTWVNYDNTELEKDTDVPYGTYPSYDGATPTKAADAQYTYTFTGWNPAVSEVTGDITYTAQYDNTTNLYTVTWKNDDGTVLETDENVEYGTMPSYDSATPTKTATAEYTYTFSGWNPELSAVTGDVTYTAQYTETRNNYTVTWVNYDNTELEKDTDVPYGTYPSYDGATPTKPATAEFTFAFSGWNPEVSAVTGDITYTAQYTETRNNYTVTWVNDDNTELEKDTDVPYGTMPTYDSATPTKAADAEFTYTFVGWNPTVSEVTGDITYTAVYTFVKNAYTVTWVNYDNTLLEKDENVEYGTTPEYNSAEPEKEGDAEYTYTFAGWNPAVSEVTGDITYTATFKATKNCYTVRWINDDGEELEKDENVEYGTMPSYDSATPTKDATPEFTFTFRGWDPEVSAVTGDVTYTAQYDNTTNLYTITWADYDGKPLEIDENVPYGTMPTYDGGTRSRSLVPEREGNAQYSYEFAGWDPEVHPVTGDETYTATYDEILNGYTVTWVNEDGTLLEKDEDVLYGTMPEYNGETPEKEGDAQTSYTFTGWNPEVSEVTGDITYTAMYNGEVNAYTVKWVNYDNTLLEVDEDVDYGTMPEYNGKKPEREGTEKSSYVFTGWNPEVSEVKGNITYTAQYEEVTNTYTVKWTDEDGTLLETDEKVEYGTMPSYDGKTPTKKSDDKYNYIFDGWTPAIKEVTGDITYTAKYKAVAIPEKTKEPTADTGVGDNPYGIVVGMISMLAAAILLKRRSEA